MQRSEHKKIPYVKVKTQRNLYGRYEYTNILYEIYYD
jgi:hypothetical protein